MGTWYRMGRRLKKKYPEMLVARVTSQLLLLLLDLHLLVLEEIQVLLPII